MSERGGWYVLAHAVGCTIRGCGVLLLRYVLLVGSLLK